MAVSTASGGNPFIRSLRASSHLEWARRASRPTALATGSSEGGGRLEDGVGRLLLCRTGRSPHRAQDPDGRDCPCSLLANLGLDLRGQGWVLTQVVAHVLATLTQALVAVRHPRS